MTADDILKPLIIMGAGVIVGFIIVQFVISKTLNIQQPTPVLPTPMPYMNHP